MKYSASLLSSIFNDTWSISTGNDGLLCKRRGIRHQIDYYDIQVIRVDKGIIWHTVTVTTQKQHLQLEGLSGKVARSLSKDLEDRTKDSIITRILCDEAMLAEVENQTKKLLESDRYISHSDIRDWLSQIPGIGQDLTHPFFDPELLPKHIRSGLNLFQEVRKPDSTLLKQVNEDL